MSFKAGFVGLLGLPNAGKSTVTNALIGEKVSIVTSKPQTTRKRIVGVYTDENLQALLVDAPGMVQASSGLNHFLQKEYQDVLQQSDVLLVVLNLDAKKPEHLDEVIQLAEQSGKPWMGIINKEDLPQFHRVLILREKVKKLGRPVVVASALKKPEVLKETVLEFLAEHLPESPAPLYDQELYTLSNMKEMAAEIIREKCFEFLHQEIPFGLAVRILRFIEDEGPTLKIYGEILLAKANHKPMVIGQQGKKLKMIGTAARFDMEKIFARKVFLDLHVNVQKNWSKNDLIMKELGYVLPENQEKRS